MPNYLGDSLCAAASAQDQPGRIYFPWLISMLTGGPLPNVMAIAGNGAADQAAPAYNCALDDTFMIIGTNDRLNYRIGGVPNSDLNGVALFKNIVKAISYWTTGDMLRAQAPGWTFSGTWFNYLGPPWPTMGKYSNVAGSIASATFDGDVLLIGYTMADGGGMGPATVAVDGAVVNAINCNPPRVIGFGAGHSLYAPGVFRAAGFGPGTHTVTITTMTSAYVMLDWIGRPPSTRKMRLLTLPYVGHGDDAEVDAYNNALRQVATQCVGDGYRVWVIETGSVVRANELCSNFAPNNDYHPNNHGHMNMARKIIASL